MTSLMENAQMENEAMQPNKLSMEKTMDSIRQKQATIDLLLEEGSMEFGSGGLSNRWQLEPLYQEVDCSLGFVHISTIELGPCAEHIHPESTEYLIVVKGSVVLNIDGVDLRVLKVGECASIPKGSKHFSRPLENDTKLIYVCIPRDDYLTKAIKHE